MIKEKNKIIAVVPVKKNSDRVNNKNFRKFYKGKSLFDLLLEKLLSSKNINKIYISSNNIALKNKVEKLGCSFIKRKDSYCNNKVPWSDMNAHTIQSIPEKDNTTIAWCHTTCPLFDSYDLALNKYKYDIKNNKSDGLVVVSKISEFIVSERKQPLNYSWGPWHKYSQHLDKLYKITGSLFIAKKIDMINNRYVISKNPTLFEVSSLESMDIDTRYDFELAKLLFKNKKYLMSHA